MLDGRVVANKSEWEAFLAEHKKFELGYEILLRKIQAIQAKVTAQEELMTAQMTRSNSALNQIRRSLETITEETERELDAIQ